MKGCNDYTEEARGWSRSKNRERKPTKLITIVVILSLVAVAFFFLWPRLNERAFSLVNDKEINTLVSEPETKTTEEGENANETDETKTSVKQAQIIIYLTGAVTVPGVYELPEKARINDAIIAAQGLSDEAATDYINLASTLQDGEHIHIPTLTEIESGEVDRINAGSTNTSGSGSIQQKDTSYSEDQKININTAGSAQLQTLPGIGEITAKRIIDYREKNGLFKSLEDLRNVSGIGEKKYADLVDKVCI